MSKKQWVVSIGLIALGTMFFGFSYSVFLLPHMITGGGLSGIALIIYTFTEFPPGIMVFILNVPLFVLAVKNVGKRYFILSVIGMTLYTVFIEIFLLAQEPLLRLLGHPDIMLSAFYAGLFGGIGTGTVVRAGGSTGGSDLIGGLINRKRPNISVGQVMTMFDFAVVILNSSIHGDFSIALYSIIAIFICMLVIDFVIDGFKECRAYYIISNKYDEISAEILTRLNRGATKITAQGVYSKREKNMVLVLIRRRQQAELRNIVNNVDPSAFMFSVSAKEVFGEGFNSIDPKEKTESKTKGDNTHDNSREIHTGNH